MESAHCNCGEAHSDSELGVHYNLFERIDFENFECLNEELEDTGKGVFRPWEARLDRNLVYSIIFFPLSRLISLFLLI